MTYKSIIFWGGLILLDTALFMGLPEKVDTSPIQQSRLEPVHCWEGANDGRQVAVASGSAEAPEKCQPTSQGAISGETVLPQVWKPERRQVSPDRPRLQQVSISIQSLI